MKAFIIGMLLIFLGILFIVASSISNVSVSNGGFAGVIMIGPIPIVIGGGNPSMMPTLLTFALIFTIIALLFYLIPLLLARKARQ